MGCAPARGPHSPVAEPLEAAQRGQHGRLEQRERQASHGREETEKKPRREARGCSRPAERSGRPGGFNSYSHPARGTPAQVGAVGGVLWKSAPNDPRKELGCRPGLLGVLSGHESLGLPGPFLQWRADAQLSQGPFHT